MNRKNWEYWTYRNDDIFVQKYTGEVSKEDIISNDKYFLTEVYSEVRKLLVLVDVSKADFNSISYEEISEVFGTLNEYLKELAGTKIAIYNGDNSRADFLKTSTYSKHEENLPVSIKGFVTLTDAMDWLECTDEEKKEISNQLKSI